MLHASKEGDISTKNVIEQKFFLLHGFIHEL